jgi:HSP20 family protein
MNNGSITTTESVPGNAENASMPITREENRFLVPPVDIYETDDGLTVIADLPGVQKDQIDIRVENGRLTIEGRQPSQSVVRDALASEFRLMNFYRQFVLSDEVDQDRISADLKHGVLTISLPKAEAAKPRRIEVNVGG